MMSVNKVGVLNINLVHARAGPSEGYVARFCRGRSSVAPPLNV
jgi:hypothetical protein